MYIYSTISADVDYQTEHGNIRVNGQANIANRNFITPRGVATKVTDEQFAELKKNHVFQLHMENGFISAERHREDADKVASNMTGRDKSAPDTPETMLLDGDVEEVKGTVIKRRRQRHD